MVYSAKIAEEWGELVYPKRINITTTLKEIKKCQNKSKKTYWRLQSDDGVSVDWNYVIPIKMETNNVTHRSWQQKLSVFAYYLPEHIPNRILFYKQHQPIEMER
jgi:hypothetical protein